MHPVAQQLELLTDQRPLDAGYAFGLTTVASLPLRKPVESSDEDASVFRRKNGSTTFTVTTTNPVIQTDRGDEIVPIGVPYGRFPRMLMLAMGNHAKSKGASRFWEIGTIQNFLPSLGIKLAGDVSVRTKEQLLKLCFATFGFSGETSSQFGQMNSLLIEKGVFQTEDLRMYKEGRLDKVHWPEGVVLASSAWENFRDNMVPIPMSCLRPISHSAIAIDIFTYLCHRLPLIRPGQTELFTYSDMNNRFGPIYASNPGRFKEYYGKAIRLALNAYPCAKVEETDQGLLLRHSDPADFVRHFYAAVPVQPRATRKRRKLADQRLKEMPLRNE